MIVITSSRRVWRLVLAALLALVIAGLATVATPSVIYRCPCGSYTVWGMSFCHPCWASRPAAPRGFAVGLR